MKSISIVISAVWLVGGMLGAPVRTYAQGSLEGVVTNLSSLLGLSSNLTVNLKGLTGTDKTNTTFGIEYDFKRNVLTNLLGSKQRFLDLDIHSSGLIAFDAKKSPNHLLTHGLRASVINLWPDTLLTGANATKAQTIANKLTTDLFRRWQEQQEVWKRDKNSQAGTKAREEMTKIVNEADAFLATADVAYKKVETDDEEQFWYASDGAGQRVAIYDVAASLATKRSPLLLIWDVDADAETDQTFDDVQFVGSTQLRAILKPDWFDLPFALIRGYKTPRDFRNRNAGPYFYGGVSIVDASKNDSRQAITGGVDDVFTRAHFGIGYRAELWALTETKSLALELQWRYYHEFNAPVTIRQRNLEDSSYFKATLLFPGNVFIEYTDGRLPLDVEGASTIGLGWRYQF